MAQSNDLYLIIRGIRQILNAGIRDNTKHYKYICNNSTFKNIPTEIINTTRDGVPKNINIKYVLSEFAERINVVIVGLQYYYNLSIQKTPEPKQTINESELDELNTKFESIFDISNFEKIMKNKDKEIEKIKKYNYDLHSLNKSIEDNIENKKYQPDLSNSEKPISNISHENLIKKEKIVTQKMDNAASLVCDMKPQELNMVKATTSKAKPKIKQSLSETARQRAVPSSRIGRLFAFGSLAANLGVNTAKEFAKSSLGSVESSESTFLSPANAEIIVNTLCKVRGAALKLGQLLSLQDESMISPELQKIFERVRQSADFMPKRQVEAVMTSQLGSIWREKYATFEDKPFAAASIGQVHLATLLDGTEVAVKIQYPGVAKSINSDIDNLVAVLNVWNIFPKGLFIENIVEVAKKELSWEVDYVREAECTVKFKKYLEPYNEYYVPAVVADLSTQQVLTTELVEGLPLDKCFNMDIKTRENIAYKIMKLCLLEMFVFRCMQTDPNWSNFFYNSNNDTLVLLDFGATREYSKKFMNKYIELIKTASDGNAEKVLVMSKEMKFLTGYESEIMEQAHVDTVMIMAEVFKPRDGEKFDFGVQSTTQRIQKLVPTVLQHRLCPPPEEIYSLHRKLSGVFLLCSKLKVKMDCRDLFNRIYEKYDFSDNK